MNLYVWGTGRLVGKVIGKYIQLDDVEGFIDSNKKADAYMGKKVILPEELVKGIMMRFWLLIYTQKKYMNNAWI